MISVCENDRSETFYRFFPISNRMTAFHLHSFSKIQAAEKRSLFAIKKALSAVPMARMVIIAPISAFSGVSAKNEAPGLKALYLIIGISYQIFFRKFQQCLQIILNRVRTPEAMPFFRINSIFMRSCQPGNQVFSLRERNGFVLPAMEDQ